MKIASFNINNINRRLTNLLNWLREAEPDIVCLQELKGADTEFPAEAIRPGGISCRLPRREKLERRGHPSAMGSGCDAHGLARR
jgi:exonuclease III